MGILQIEHCISGSHIMLYHFVGSCSSHNCLDILIMISQDSVLYEWLSTVDPLWEVNL